MYLYMSLRGLKMFKKFGEQQPPSTGWYRVVWEENDPIFLVYLWDCREMLGNDDTECKWNWGINEHDYPEAIERDIDDWKQIQWQSVEFEEVEKC